MLRQRRRVKRSQVLDRGLDRIQCGEHPRAGPCQPVRIARRQRFGLLGDVEHDGARLEQLQFVRLDRRDLAKRLQRTIARARLILRTNQALAIGDARFFQRPPESRAPGPARRRAPNGMQ